MLMQFLESIMSKLGELIVDRALNSVISIKDFKLTLSALQNNLKSLRAKASDVEEEIKKAELSGQKKRKRDVEDWLGEVKSFEQEVVELEREVESEGFISRFVFGGRAAELNEQACKLVEQTPQFGELVADVCRSKGVTLLTNGMVGEAFAKNMENIWSLLMSGQVLSIGIHGMGGGGKTTLAKHIHNRLREESKARVFWVTVSQEFTIKSLQDKIASFLDVDFLDEDDEDIRAGRLYEDLSRQKNSVVILDDVWENIDLVKVGCPFSVECCRLIITTRSLEVCRQIGCQKVITVQKLDEDEARTLFNEVFTLGKEIKLAPKVEELVKSVAKLCDGLPLGIITLAGSMRGETSIHTWRNALLELKETQVGQGGKGKVEIFKVLKYSFDRLDMNHESESNEFNQSQLCFLYCSLYPEDYEIDIEELVKKLISDGLVERGKNRREQVDQGHVILDNLAKVCLLESCVGSFGQKCVKMHDLVRGMALKIGKGKYLVRAEDTSMEEIPMEQEWTEQLEKVSLMRNNIRRIGEGTSPNCPNLSTLLLQQNYFLEFIPDSFFWRMQGLHTLDLSSTRISMLPNSISELRSLKALLLLRCEKLEHVPNLGNLKALRELNLDYTAIKEVPEGVEELLNLKFISFQLTRLKVLRRGLLLKLVGLQILRLPPHVQVAIEEILNLKQLEEFEVGMKNVGDLNSFITSGVHDRTIYRIQVGSIGEDFIGYENKFDNAVFTTEFNLKVEGVLGRKQNIKCLTLKNCEGLNNCLLDYLPWLNNFTSLGILRIERCGRIECILRSEQAGLASSRFPTLEGMVLIDLENLKGLVDKGEETGGASAAPPLSAFSSLSICNCNKMSNLGISVWDVPNLEKIDVIFCSEIEEIFEDQGTGSHVALPKLQSLALVGLPRLKSVCKATIIYNSIKIIFIHKCNKMRKLGISALEVPNLEDLKIAECSEIEEIFEDHQGTGFDVALPKLQYLRLEKLPRLKSVWKAPIICNSIKEISFHECNKMRKLGISVLEVPNLEYLIITNCSEIEEIFEDHQATGFDVALPKLQYLRLEKLPRLKSVWKAPIICNSIKEISIHECNKMRKLGISVLEVPNLLIIYIMDCSELEEIFEDDQGTGALPKLQYLSLVGLPRLERLCKETIICNSIEEITILRCLMKSMPLHLDDPLPPSLKQIYVEREWWESLEWNNPKLPTLLQPFLRLRERERERGRHRR